VRNKGHAVGPGVKPTAAQVLMGAWEHRGLLAYFLFPIALLYRALLWLRRLPLRLGWSTPQRLNCAVIVVGNAIVGGAGKTPTTIGIVQHLQGRGLQVGVVSRGYGRADQNVCAVTPTMDASVCGDEPLLLAQATHVPVFVAANRHAAGAALLAAHPATQVIVCDDGLQHYGLWRDLEVCVFDDRGCGNGYLLPSGPLREPWPRKPLSGVGQRDDRLLVLHTGTTAAFSGFRAHRSLSKHARTKDSNAVALETLQSPLLALAGIARPETFFTSLRGMGLVLDRTLPLPDHFDFSRLDTATLRGCQVLCTEKDAVKLWKVWPEALAVPLLQTLEPAFLQALDAMLGDVLAAKLSSTHGHQIA
jgi:tetraacyldisaccharide 4'-kinase